MFLPPAESPAATHLYKTSMDEQGYVINLARLWAWRPDVFAAFSELRTLLTAGSALTQRDLGVLVCATAASLRDSYCALAWGARLASASGASAAAAVLGDTDSEALTARDLALSAWARSAATRPNATTAADLDRLRATGLNDQQIFEATAVIAFRVAFSTVNDALGARPDWQLADAAPAEVRSAVTFGRPVAPRGE